MVFFDSVDQSIAEVTAKRALLPKKDEIDRKMQTDRWLSFLKLKKFRTLS